MISVCIATYNGSEHILTQLQSILSQLSEEDEVIVSDDNSKDDTRQIVASIKDRRIRLVHGPAIGSPIKNFENALTKAKGDLIFLSDQDDKWLPGKVDFMKSRLLSGNTDCVITDCIVTNSSLQEIKSSFFAVNKTRSGKFYNLFLKNGYLGCCMAFTRRVLMRSLPFPQNIPMHDIWIGNVAAFYYNVEFVDKPYIFYRRHEHNATPTTAHGSDNPIFTRLIYRWNILRPLCKLLFMRRN